VIRGNFKEFLIMLDALDLKDKTPFYAKQVKLLERRNYEGKTALMLAIEHERMDISTYIVANFKDINLDKCDVKHGNCSLHLACLKEDIEIVKIILETRP
jgi:ankyrin repeat protein